MALFNVEQDQDEATRLYVRVDDKFDICINRTDEGLIVDVYGGNRNFVNLLATAAVMNDDVLEMA